MKGLYGTDAYSPDEIAEQIEEVGVKKANLPILKMVALGLLAGGFIALGAMFYTVVASDQYLSFALSRVLGGVAFSLGLILVVIAGAELFTGNNLLVIAWVHQRISTRLLMQNFLVVYFANLAGSLVVVLLVYYSGTLEMNRGGVGEKALAIAVAKTELPAMEAFVRGILCNILVCLAVWLAAAGRQVVNRVLAIVFPITAFVACGFEHCVANMYFIPLGYLCDQNAITLGGYLANLVPVTLGNVVGGAGMVGLVAFVIYRRGEDSGAPGTGPGA